MNDHAIADHATREDILMLLTDDEVSSVCTAETASRPLDGEEYLDLEDLGRGVRSSIGKTPAMGRLLLRRAVHQSTWTKILKRLEALPRQKTPSKA
jgi:hypothetical protein